MSKELSQSLILRQKRQQQQCSLSPIEVEEIMSPEVDAQGGAGALLTGGCLATILNCDNASPHPQSENNPATPQLEEFALPDAVDSDVSIEGEDDVMLSRSVANIAIAPNTLTNDPIDQLTEQLAAFCFGHVVKTLSSSDGNDGMDMNLDTEAFEEELRV